MLGNVKEGNAGNKVIVLDGEGSICEVFVAGTQLEHVLEFRCSLDDSDTNGTECHRKVVSGMKVPGAFGSLVNVRSLQLECTRAA